MTNKQYLDRQIELTKQLECAANLRPYDQDFYNETIEEMKAHRDRYYRSRQGPLSLRIILWIIALLFGAYILYTVITGS